MQYVIVSDFEDPEDGVLFWSNVDGWVDRASATLFSEEGILGNLPLEAAGWVKVAPSYSERVADALVEEGLHDV